MTENVQFRKAYYFPQSSDIPEDMLRILRPTGREQFDGDCLDDHFYPDGTPVSDRLITPDKAALILGTAVPWEYAKIEPYYSKAAATEVYHHMSRLFPSRTDPFAERQMMDGFQVQVGSHTFAIPDYTNEPIIVVPDVSPNDELWENNRIPVYVLQRVRLYMALIRCHDINQNYPLAGIYVVRIKGNLTADLDFRWIESDPPRENAILQSVLKVLDRRAQAGLLLIPETVIIPKRNWGEIHETQKDEADKICDDNLHDMIAKYMSVRSQRKTLERQSRQLKEEEDAIAASLVNLIQDAKSGTVEDPVLGTKYSIQHKKSAVRARKITPELVRLFAPEFSMAIVHDSSVKGRVDIDVI